ncbi:hypothetical protein HpBGD38_14910 [Helicobacter pylori]
MGGGGDNFVANLIWQKKKGGSQDSENFAKEHEYILCYQKDLTLHNNRDVDISLDHQLSTTKIDNNKAPKTKIAQQTTATK